jgi:hypothetical protein
MSSESTGLRRDGLIVGASLALAGVYATLRYNVFKGVPWSDWPHYIVNKVFAVASLLLFAAAVYRLVNGGREPIRRLMSTASGLAIAHTLISVGMFTPTYYEKFFAAGKLTAAAGASLTLAAIAVALLQWGKGRPGSAQPERAALLIAAIAFLSGVHAALPAVGTWLTPSQWPGRMPPLTLISFSVGLATLLAAVPWRTRERSLEPRGSTQR